MTRPDDTNLASLETTLGHRFRDPSLAQAALTHPSYAAERPDLVSYERLEFLGDAVLGFVIADELFRRYPDAEEGRLTKHRIALVSGGTLATIARECAIDRLLLVGEGERRTGGSRKSSVLENALEALIGAVYLDGGIDAARRVIVRLFAGRLERAPEHTADDAKSRLQELTQARGLGLPEYRVVAEGGPPHAPTFTVEVLIAGSPVGSGVGPSKQRAEKAAAADALSRIGEAP